MQAYVALLRAINVGGTGILPMKELVALCSGLGFQNVRTYIQSGNVVFAGELKEDAVRTKLEHALEARMKKPVGVMVRTPAELRAILKSNPFPDAEPAKVLILFLQEAPAKVDLKDIATPGGEMLQAGKREIYVYYPEGMGRSKLKLPLPKEATARNVNTVRKLLELSEKI